MRNLPFIIFAVLVVVFAIGLAIPEKERKAPAQTGLLGKPLPNLTLRELDTDTIIGNDAFRDNVTVLNVFASWCSPCIEELPELAALKQQFPNMQLLGIGWHDGANNIRKWAKQYNAPYHRILLDTERQIGVQLGIRGVPETFIIDASGVVRYHLPAAVHPTIIKNEIAPLLTELSNE